MRATGMLIGLALTGLFARALDAQGDPPGRAARLGGLAGEVSFQASGFDTWSTATANLVVTSGDRLYVDRGGHAELDLGGFAVRASEATDLTISTLTDHLLQLGLSQGAIRVSVYALPPDDSIEAD